MIKDFAFRVLIGSRGRQTPITCHPRSHGLFPTPPPPAKRGVTLESRGANPSHAGVTPESRWSHAGVTPESRWSLEHDYRLLTFSFPGFIFPTLPPSLRTGMNLYCKQVLSYYPLLFRLKCIVLAIAQSSLISHEQKPRPRAGHELLRND